MRCQIASLNQLATGTLHIKNAEALYTSTRKITADTGIEVVCSTERLEYIRYEPRESRDAKQVRWTRPAPAGGVVDHGSGPKVRRCLFSFCEPWLLYLVKLSGLPVLPQGLAGGPSRVASLLGCEPTSLFALFSYSWRSCARDSKDRRVSEDFTRCRDFVDAKLTSRCTGPGSWKQMPRKYAAYPWFLESLEPSCQESKLRCPTVTTAVWTSLRSQWLVGRKQIQRN